jgi:hypothetical protein
MRFIRRLLEVAWLGSIVIAVSAPDFGRAQDDVYAWVHGIGMKEYFMPGGPQESWLSGCIVQTWLGKDPAHDYASMTVTDGYYNGMNTNCDVPNSANFIQIVTLQGGGRLHSGAIAHPVDFNGVLRNGGPGGYDYAWNLAWGDPGEPIFGAHVSAINKNGFKSIWDITVF